MAARAEHQGAGRRMGGMKVQVTPKATTTFHALDRLAESADAQRAGDPSPRAQRLIEPACACRS